MYRGSRKHILDWTSRDEFLEEFVELISLPDFAISASSVWKPKGYEKAKEACLDNCGHQFIFDKAFWDNIAAWWLRHRKGANTPNWDLVVSCYLDCKPGLALIEAKAHERELGRSGKRLHSGCSQNSIENHKHINKTITEASQALNRIIQGIHLSSDSHYQLANRVTFSWKFASMGLPVLLVYLGFIGDEGISDVGPPLRDHRHWESVMRSYAKGTLPPEIFDQPLNCGKAKMRMIIRSRETLEQSKRRVGK